MVHEKKSEMENQRSLQWNSKLIKGLQLRESDILLIQDIMSTVSSLCDSITLYGSWANGVAKCNSDLDILFITGTESERLSIVSEIEKILEETTKTHLDYKVVTASEFKTLSGGLLHFTIWLMLTTGITLYGHDAKELVTLDYEKLRGLLNDLMEKINLGITDLSTDYQYRKHCIQVANILRTLYFIESSVLVKKRCPETKQEYLIRHLGFNYKTIERIYREDIVSKKTFGTFGLVQKKPVRKRNRYTPAEYKDLLTLFYMVEEMISTCRKQLESVIQLL